MDFENLLLAYLTAVKRTPAMRDAVKQAWRRFAAYCRERELEPKDLVPRHLDDFLQALQWEPSPHRGQLLSANTVDQKMRCIRQVLRWATAAGHFRLDPGRALVLSRPPQPTRHYLTWKEVQAILNAPDRSDPKGLRDATMLAILVEANLKFTECCALQLNQHQELPLEPPTRDLVDAYVKQARPLWVRPTTGKKLLFLNPFGGPLSSQTARSILQRAAQVAGLDVAPSLKCLRRSYWAHLRGQSQGRLPSSFNRDLN